MKRVAVSFWSAESVLDFLKITAVCSCDLNLVCKNQSVDAKSLLGVFSVKSETGMKLLIHNDNCDYLLNRLDSFIQYAKMNRVDHSSGDTCYEEYNRCAG